MVREDDVMIRPVQVPVPSTSNLKKTHTRRRLRPVLVLLIPVLTSEELSAFDLCNCRCYCCRSPNILPELSFDFKESERHKIHSHFPRCRSFGSNRWWKLFVWKIRPRNYTLLYLATSKTEIDQNGGFIPIHETLSVTRENRYSITRSQPTILFYFSFSK